MLKCKEKQESCPNVITIQNFVNLNMKKLETESSYLDQMPVVQTIFFGIRGYFETSMFEIIRVI